MIIMWENLGLIYGWRGRMDWATGHVSLFSGVRKFVCRNICRCLYSSVIQLQKENAEKELPFVGNCLYLIQNVEFQGITGLECIILLWLMVPPSA